MGEKGERGRVGKGERRERKDRTLGLAREAGLRGPVSNELHSSSSKSQLFWPSLSLGTDCHYHHLFSPAFEVEPETTQAWSVTSWGVFASLASKAAGVF